MKHCAAQFIAILMAGLGIFGCSRREEVRKGQIGIEGSQPRSQQEMYVQAEVGVHISEQPSIEARVIAVAPFASSVVALKRLDRHEVIGGVSGHWVQVSFQSQIGFVFSAYLSFERPKRVVHREYSPDHSYYYEIWLEAHRATTNHKYPGWVRDLCGTHYTSGCSILVFSSDKRQIRSLWGGVFGWFDSQNLWIEETFGDAGTSAHWIYLLDVVSGHTRRLFFEYSRVDISKAPNSMPLQAVSHCLGDLCVVQSEHESIQVSICTPSQPLTDFSKYEMFALGECRGTVFLKPEGGFVDVSGQPTYVPLSIPTVLLLRTEKSEYQVSERLGKPVIDKLR